MLEFNLKFEDAIKDSKSNGWLAKWTLGSKGKETWIKSPSYILYWGLETYAEVIASCIAKDLGVSNYLEYTYCIVNTSENRIACCKSDTFLNTDAEVLITIHKLIQLGMLKDDSNYRGFIGFKTLITDVKQLIGLDIEECLNDTVLMDALICNSDRHFWNIGIIHNNTTKRYRMAPIFDNGNAFGFPVQHTEYFSMDYIYSYGISAKPFDIYFENQVSYIQDLSRYKNRFEHTTSMLNFIKNNMTDINNKFGIDNPVPIETFNFMQALIYDRINKFNLLV